MDSFQIKFHYLHNDFPGRGPGPNRGPGRGPGPDPGPEINLYYTLKTNGG